MKVSQIFSAAQRPDGSLSVDVHSGERPNRSRYWSRRWLWLLRLRVSRSGLFLGLLQLLSLRLRALWLLRTELVRRRRSSSARVPGITDIGVAVATTVAVDTTAELGYRGGYGYRGGVGYARTGAGYNHGPAGYAGAGHAFAGGTAGGYHGIAQLAVVITAVAASTAVVVDSTAVVVGSAVATVVAAADTGKQMIDGNGWLRPAVSFCGLALSTGSL